MTGEQLYDEWCNAGDDGAALPAWNHLTPGDHARWECLARIVYIV